MLEKKFVGEDITVPVGKISRETWNRLSQAEEDMSDAIVHVVNETLFSC